MLEMFTGTRAKTGIVLLIIFLTVGYINSIPLTWLFFGIPMLIAVKEAMNLFNSNDDKIYVYAIFIWIVAYFYPKPEDLVFVVGILFASILAYTKEFNKNLFLPLMYPIASFLFLFSLYVSYGIESILWLVAVVAGTDIGAYFVGKTVGSTKFCETSPNKTLEGVAGGVITAAILGLIFAPEEINFVLAIGVSLVVAIASVFGDLFESYLKREADVKDSGISYPVMVVF